MGGATTIMMALTKIIRTRSPAIGFSQTVNAANASPVMNQPAKILNGRRTFIFVL